jgi:hypothetical protein
MPSIIAVAKLASPASDGRSPSPETAISDAAIGSIIMVVAVLLIHMLNRAVASMAPATRLAAAGRPA